MRKTVDISFLLASKRPYEIFGRKVVDSICRAEQIYTSEILVCSPERIEDKRVVWVKDNKCNGSVSAFNCLVQEHVNGAFGIVAVDDHRVSENIFKVIDFLESPAFKDRKYKITTLSVDKQIAYPEKIPSFDVLLKTEYSRLPQYPVMPYPVFSIETVKKHMNNFLFHPCFRHHFCDHFLGIYLGLNGEPGIQYNHSFYDRIGYSLFFQEREKTFDKILNGNFPKKFGESYINLYKLMSHYKAGMPYVDNKFKIYDEG